MTPENIDNRQFNTPESEQAAKRLVEITDKIVGDRYTPFYILPETAKPITESKEGKGGIRARLKIDNLLGRLKRDERYNYDLMHVAEPESGMAVIQLYTAWIIWQVEQGYVKEWGKYPAGKWFGPMSEQLLVRAGTNDFIDPINLNEEIEGSIKITDERVSRNRNYHIMLNYDLGNGRHSGTRHLVIKSKLPSA